MKSIIKTGLIFTALLLVVAGCEYDVAQPQWTLNHEDPPSPTILEVDPPDAVAGVNTISIIGENFADVQDNNKVYFDNLPVEIIESSTGMITVRRPNLVNEAAQIKVVSYGALLVASYGPYRVDAVVANFGNFIENVQLNAVAVDRDENVYIVDASTSRNIFKITPEGEKTVIGRSGSVIYDMNVAPNGNLILMTNSNSILQLDLAGGQDSTSLWVDGPKRTKFGDFDEYGNFYAGAKSSDLVIVKNDLSTVQAGAWARDEIFYVRVFGGYVYVLVELRSGEPELAIWRQPIQDAEGSLGAAELVLDWAETGIFAESTPMAFTFDASGNMFIAVTPDGTLNEDPLIMLTASGDLDVMYKNILVLRNNETLSYIKQMFWGTGTHVYAVTDGPASGDPERTLLKVNMGVQGAPYYGG
ncbi:IPT/TIG domain-containing protein [bacterium]|nr:IPT/TIG domain-containing protein [bacterium]